MGLFSKKTPLDAVTTISVFPTIGTVVLRKRDKLVVFNPRYLLGKHGAGSEEVASKFQNLKTATQLLELIEKHVSAHQLSGSKVEVKELDFYEQVGWDALVEVGHELARVLPKEDVRGNTIKVIYTKKDLIPATSLLNIILVPFDPKFGDGVENLFKQKYGFVGFEQFTAVYAIVTIFPGKFAPVMSNRQFWDRHALLRKK